MKTIKATVANTEFTFKFMTDEEGGDVLVVLCPWDGEWHEAFHYFSVNYNEKHWTQDELRAISDKLDAPVWVIREELSGRYYGMPAGNSTTLFTEDRNRAFTYDDNDKARAEATAWRLNDACSHTPASWWVVRG